ncbi:conserved hypothetical protein [Culex quinquefasciatus]|uniref:RNA-binding protein 48 n=1 Tax=Culex quinquefasciatus TaxID=7176 RepID=B0WZT6_CULQU|nr:conserved hypothetical protein [Culex quinquefasciatus]|eukprot:XP_001862908.1 conserved hypothetical protein [Culex quinquefasciatus]
MSSDPEPNAPNNNNLSHHVRHEYCHNRPSYRASRKQTAVKIDLLRELKVEFRRYGTVQLVQNVTEAVKATGSVEVEPFTDVFHVRFEKLERARRAKKLLDAKNFYGGILHLSYAPERESIEELRQKLAQRRREVAFRVPKKQKATVARGDEPQPKRVKKC